jgi:hypothetical protein
MDYLKVEELKPYYTYRIKARNGRVGIWTPESGDFQLRRTKFNSIFVFGEVHWDLDPHFGTAKPWEELEQSPFDYDDFKYATMTWDEYCGTYDKELPDWADASDNISIRFKESTILNYLKVWEDKIDDTYKGEI